MQKTLILLGAGGECVHAILHAKKLGYRVLATDKNPQACGATVADEFLPLCAYTPEESVAGLLAWRERGGDPGGVLCVAVDAPTTVAAVGQALNLPAISVETAQLATDKLAMKDRFKARGIPIPWYAPARDSKDIREAAKDIGYPLVIKPVDSRGARGVLRLTPDVDVDWAFETAQKASPTGRVMLEQFLDGPQVSTEGLMVNGVAHIPGFSDRNYEFLERFAPHIIENGGDLPSLLPEKAQQEIRELTGRAALALGLTHGPVKGDMLWHDGKAYVIEIAARHSGGYFVTHEIPWNTGIDLLGASIHMAMGKFPAPETLVPQSRREVCQRWIFAPAGRVRHIDGLETAQGMPHVRYVELRIKQGDVIPPVTSHPARSGVVMTVAKTREQAMRAAGAAVRSIVIQTDEA
jgi:biotin carboxylase